VSQRFSEAGAADPAIAAPVVAFLIEHAAEVEAVRYRFTEEASKLITSWLRSIRRAEMVGTTIDRWQPLRARVREYLLLPGRADYEIEAECLALLGADTDAQATGHLRGLASRQPNRLAACIELFDPTMSLAATDLDLLFELTEAYYIEHPSVSGPNWLDMGIRRHKHTHGGFGVPFADWRFGPFWRLLPAAPGRALALINRMLDHATELSRQPAAPGGSSPWPAGRRRARGQRRARSPAGHPWHRPQVLHRRPARVGLVPGHGHRTVPVHERANGRRTVRRPVDPAGDAASRPDNDADAGRA
jgi:hypothetical protein